MKFTKLLPSSFLTVAFALPAFCSDDINNEGKRTRVLVSKAKSQTIDTKKSKKDLKAEPVSLAIFISEKYKPAPLRAGQTKPAFFIQEAVFELGKVQITGKNRKELLDFKSDTTVITLTDKYLKLFAGIKYADPKKKILLETGKSVGVVPVFKDDDQMGLFERLDSSGLLHYREIVKK